MSEIIYKGIDLSTYNGSNIDFKKIKADGIDFVILRAGYGRLASQKDSRFEDYYKGATEAGLEVGCYWYNYATSVSEAITEANVFLQCIKGKKFSFPCYYDVEESRVLNGVSKATLTSMVNAFCSTVESNGYMAGLYTFYSAKNKFNQEEIRYEKWLAKWSNSMSECSTNEWGLWQYAVMGSTSECTKSGKINGCNCEAVDLNYSYKDYPKMIGVSFSGKTPITESPEKNSSTKPLRINSSLTKSNIVSYKFNDTTQLSAHFKVSEFKCKCGENHNIVINDLLIAKLEKLYETVDKIYGCSMIIVDRGYNCKKMDLSKGGTGYGQHTNGNAADVIVYDKNKKPISSKIISCLAQDLGFTGIGNYTNKYDLIHLDAGANRKWYGDETTGHTNNVTSDFYKYYGLTKDQVYKKTTTPITSNVSTTPTFKAGQKVNVSGNLYTNSTNTAPVGKRSGIYFVYNSIVINGRIRLTNSEANVGKQPAGKYVSGWFNVKDIK